MNKSTLHSHSLILFLIYFTLFQDQKKNGTFEEISFQKNLKRINLELFETKINLSKMKKSLFCFSKEFIIKLSIF
jgi:hypothetical protein